MPSVIIGLALLAFWLYCLFDVITTPEPIMRNLPKPVWVLIVALLAALGGVLWLLLGRPQGSPALLAGPDRRPEPAEAPRGPDDDPEFLRRLERRIRGEE